MSTNCSMFFFCDNKSAVSPVTGTFHVDPWTAHQLPIILPSSHPHHVHHTLLCPLAHGPHTPQTINLVINPSNQGSCGSPKSIYGCKKWAHLGKKSNGFICLVRKCQPYFNAASSLVFIRRFTSDLLTRFNWH